jgi:hypothetical protein
MQTLKGEQAAAGQQELAGKAALIASVGGQRGFADWTNPRSPAAAVAVGVHRRGRADVRAIWRRGGPDVAIGNLSTWWVYLIGPVAGAVIAVGVAYVLRGPAKVQEARAAQGTPLDRTTA